MAISFAGSAIAATPETPDATEPDDSGVLGNEIRQLQVLIPAGLVNRQEQHQWQRYVRYFRQGHHLGLSFGHASTVWSVESYEAVPDAKYQSTSWDATFSYAYFLPLVRKLGYYLGTSVGTARHTSVDSNFTPPTVTKYPGVSVGLAYAPHPGLRFGGGFNGYLERWDGVRVRQPVRVLDSTPPPSAVHVTSETVDISAFCDIFFSLPWAIRLEAHEVRSYFVRPREPHGAMDSKISREGRLYGAGILHHLL